MLALSSMLGMKMATLTIRNLDDDLKASLRVRAAMNGQSMEEEVRCILRQALTKTAHGKGLGQQLIDRFQEVVGEPTEFTLPARSLPRPAPDWDEST
jgi:plasmid stability protein